MVAALGRKQGRSWDACAILLQTQQKRTPFTAGKVPAESPGRVLSASRPSLTAFPYAGPPLSRYPSRGPGELSA